MGQRGITAATAARSDKGGRPHNEDSEYFGARYGRGAWAVADGLGGMAGGELASAFVTGYIRDNVFDLRDFKEKSLLELLNGANAALSEEQERRGMRHGMRTTLVTAFMEDGTVTSVHFGDSRFYYFRDGGVLHQSRDDSMSQVAVDLGEIRLKDIRFHEDRSTVLKVLGSGEALRTRTPAFTVKAEPGDAFMLCTDGFWELVYEEEMIDALDQAREKAASRDGLADIWLENMLGVLRGRLTEKSDNYTAVCCVVQ